MATTPTKFKLLFLLALVFFIIQFFLGIKIYYNRIYIYNIAQIYILEQTIQNGSSIVNVIQNVSADNSNSVLQNGDIENGTNSSMIPSLCPVVPSGLKGTTFPPYAPTWAELERMYGTLVPGGHWRPTECTSRHKVAIIIPYRDRDTHLRTFLYHMHRFLRRQQLDYAIFVVEQMSNQTFNRGKLLNIGFTEARKLYDWQCAIFHDVDLLPEDDRNLYTCPDQPRHMSVAIDKFHYELPYKEIFGGVTALRSDQFVALNGYSNDYWGWGGEDDDMAYRVEYLGHSITRYPSNVARYKMIKHVLDKGNDKNTCRYLLNRKVRQRWRTDGLNNLTYHVLNLDQKGVFTRILVDLLEEESKKRLDVEKVCRSYSHMYLCSGIGLVVVSALLGVLWAGRRYRSKR